MTSGRARTDARSAPVDLLVLGAPKSGTSTLFAVLAAQDWFLTPRVKELHHFSAADPEPDEAYRRRFPAATRTGQLRGEATPNYLSSYVAPRRIRDHDPDVRLVAVLRDPIERAVSAYLHARRVGALPRGSTFEDVYWGEARRRVTERAWNHIRWDGMYGRHVARYREHFPAEQLHVIFLEDLVRSPAATLAALGTFVGHPELAVDVLPHENRARDVRSPRTEATVAAIVRGGRRMGLLPRDLAAPGFRALWSRDPDPPLLDDASIERLVADHRADVTLLTELVGRPPPWSRFVAARPDEGRRR